MVLKVFIFLAGTVFGWVSFAFISIPSDTRLHEVSVGKFANGLKEATGAGGAHWNDCAVTAAKTHGYYREAHCRKDLPDGNFAVAWYPFTITGGLNYFDFNVLPTTGETS